MATTQTRPAAASTAVAKYDGNAACSLQQLGAMFQDALPRVKEALPADMQKHAERLVRVAMSEIQRNPEIAKCTGFSILKCVLEASTHGLEIGGPLGQAYIIPYKRKVGETWIVEAQFQIGYRGMVALAYRSGRVTNIYAQVVREKDRFKMLAGTSPGIDHEPNPAGGKVIGVYAVIVYVSGQINFEYMTRDEVEHHRTTYSKQPQSMLWTSAWNEGAKKTVTRKLLKYAPLGVQFPTDVEEVDPDIDTVEVQPAAPQLNAPAEETPGENGAPQDGLWGGEDTDVSAQAK